MSLSRITGALVSPTIDATLALASLNFDFSLVKLEAPPEFHGLGRALSRQRREAAEAGSTHVTARKLGALFAKEVPDTPKLVEAYGKRVSEIAGSSAINPQGQKQHGIFADYMGADGTTIWAAATSGTNAISVLACMLARIWSASEATSIWAELVDVRKEQIMPVNPAEPLSYPDLLASQIQISRDQLAEWDNSARAWLQRADQAKKTEQIQTRLILDNLNVCVNAKPTTYASVMGAWKSALLGMESLLNGIPQNNSDGGLLLALLSWHLYPDLIALGGTLVSQRDELFPSWALLTLGLEGSLVHKNRGIYWSLSLAHMKYYGYPIKADGSVGDTSTRLTINEFNHIVLGSIFSSWGSDGQNSIKAGTTIIAIRNAVKGYAYPPWLDILADTAEALVASKDFERSILLRLIALGRKRAVGLLCDTNSHPPPIFGLTQFHNFVRLLGLRQDKIDILRKYTSKFFPDAQPNEVIIHYRFKVSERPIEPDDEPETSEPKNSNRAKAEPEKTEPENIESEKTEDEKNAPGKTESEKPSSPKSTLVIEVFLDPAANLSQEVEQVTVSEYTTAIPFCTECASCHPSLTDHRRIHHSWIRGGLDPTERPKSVTRRIEAESKQSKAIKDLQGSDSHWRIPVEAFNPRIRKNDTLSGSFEVIEANFDKGDSKSWPKTYDLFLGDPDTAALFVASRYKDEYEQELRAPAWSRKDNFQKKILNFDDIISALQAGLVDPQSLAKHLTFVKSKGPNGQYEGYFTSLAAVEYINELYQSMDSATINLKIASQTLKDLKWVQSLNRFTKRRRVRERSFACIAVLDTGTVDLHPSKFGNVMAMSSTDSLYIAASLMCDPTKTTSFDEIRHVIGNVGRHGLLLLVPPPVPQTLNLDLGTWREIEHAPFNGKIEDTFTGTSLHLSFTDWSTPIDLDRGQHDAEAYVVESLVSVHDHGRWIADLDILESLKKGSGQFDHEFFFKAGCSHSHSSDATPGAEAEVEVEGEGEGPGELISIKSWDEFLDRPESPSVVMTHKNWLARLAVTTLGVRRGDRVFVDDAVCAQCLDELRRFNPELAAKALFVV